MGRISASLLVTSSALVASASAVTFDFESDLCGSRLGAGVETVAHGYRQGKDLSRDAVYISNMRAHGGKRSLLVERFGPESCNYSRVVNFNLRTLDPGRSQLLEFWFYPEGNGIAAVNFETSIYGKGNAVLFRAGLSNGGFEWRKTGDVVRLGTWHRIRIRFPAAGEMGGKVVFTAECPVDGKLSVVWRSEKPVDAVLLAKGYVNLRLWFHQGLSGQRVYFDDVTAENHAD